MEIRLLKTFLAIVKYGSFHEASKALQYSQPTITFQVKKLEKELGFRLFKRGKTTELTSAGAFFLQRAEELLQKYEQFEIELQDYKQGDAGVIHIGISEPSASNRLPDILASLMAKKPKIQVKITIASNKEVVELLEDGQIDIAFCNRPEANEHLIFEHLLTETFGLLVYEDHPLAGKDKIWIRDLRDEKFIVTPGSCPFRSRVQEAFFAKAGTPLRAILEIPGINSLKYFVQSKIGIAMAPLVAISPPLPGTVLKQVEDMMDGPDIGIVTRSDQSARPLVQKIVMDEMRAVCTSQVTFNQTRTRAK